MPRIDELLRLLNSDPRDAFVLYGLAQEHAKQGDTAAALAYYDRCLAADPAYLYAYYHKAKAQAAGGDPAGATITIDAGLLAAKAARDAHAAGELEALREEIA